MFGKITKLTAKLEDGQRVEIYRNITADPETVERRDLLRRCLEEMSPGDREVLVLTLGEGLNPRDIASRLGLSPEVVRQKKCRATKRILDLVEKLSRS